MAPLVSIKIWRLVRYRLILAVVVVVVVVAIVGSPKCIWALHEPNNSFCTHAVYRTNVMWMKIKVRHLLRVLPRCVTQNMWNSFLLVLVQVQLGTPWRQNLSLEFSPGGQNEFFSSVELAGIGGMLSTQVFSHLPCWKLGLTCVPEISSQMDGLTCKYRDTDRENIAKKRWTHLKLCWRKWF